MSKKRVTITIESELYNKLRKTQSARIAKTNESMSLSQTIEEVLEKGFTND